MPAVVLFFTILAVGFTLECVPAFCGWKPDLTVVQGAQIGALGAYVYVVLFLGTRAMRGDVTSGAIMWSSVTMVCGPLLAAAVDIVFVGKVGQTDSPEITTTSALLPFAAGFSMRVVVDFANRKIRQIFAGRPATARGDSLLRLRGISYDIEERLIEEGIEDIANLAMANPHRLRRNTRFDKRQISAWIDEALLALYFPAAWPTLEANGVTGAIDLVWYVSYLGKKEIRATGGGSIDSPQPPVIPNAGLAKLAERNNLNVVDLAQIILRMYEDAQVRLIWGLYQLDDTEATGVDEWFQRFEPDNGGPSSASKDSPPSSDKPSAADGDRPKRIVPDPIGTPAAQEIWKQRFADHRGWFLVHRWHASAVARHADIVIRPWNGRGTGEGGMIRDVQYTLPTHMMDGVAQIAQSADDRFALRLRAERPFLCVARVTFQNPAVPPLVLERFVDFDTRQRIVSTD
ncbi:MAG TPA: helix-hairpin-helix domain-containing protein [Kofleriaceae bacterium]